MEIIKKKSDNKYLYSVRTESFFLNIWKSIIENKIFHAHGTHLNKHQNFLELLDT